MLIVLVMVGGAWAEEDVHASFCDSGETCDVWVDLDDLVSRDGGGTIVDWCNPSNAADAGERCCLSFETSAGFDLLSRTLGSFNEDTPEPEVTTIIEVQVPTLSDEQSQSLNMSEYPVMVPCRCLSSDQSKFCMSELQVCGAGSSSRLIGLTLDVTSDNPENLRIHLKDVALLEASITTEKARLAITDAAISLVGTDGITAQNAGSVRLIRSMLCATPTTDENQVPPEQVIRRRGNNNSNTKFEILNSAILAPGGSIPLIRGTHNNDSLILAQSALIGVDVPDTSQLHALNNLLATSNGSAPDDTPQEGFSAWMASDDQLNLIQTGDCAALLESWPPTEDAEPALWPFPTSLGGQSGDSFSTFSPFASQLQDIEQSGQPVTAPSPDDTTIECDADTVPADPECRPDLGIYGGPFATSVIWADNNEDGDCVEDARDCDVDCPLIWEDCPLVEEPDGDVHDSEVLDDPVDTGAPATEEPDDLIDSSPPKPQLVLQDAGCWLAQEVEETSNYDTCAEADPGTPCLVDAGTYAEPCPPLLAPSCGGWVTTEDPEALALLLLPLGLWAGRRRRRA